MSTSGTYIFGSATNDELVTDAFERLGELPDLFTVQQIKSATRSANLLLSEWINEGLNLWTVSEEMLNLIPNQNTYLLPTATSDVLEATIRTTTRPAGGTAFSSAGGTAQNAFDNNSATACTQTAPDGYISYNYGNNNTYGIALVGIQSNVTRDYTLVGEYSADNATWTNSVTIPVQTFTAGLNVWFVVPVPTLAQYYRIRETGGAILDVQELYFNTNVQDIPITRISREEYINYPQKNQTGRPTSFYVNRQINPTISLWPTPIGPYFNMFYTRVVEMQDLGSPTQMPEIPQRFMEAFCAGLACKLAPKYAPQKLAMLKELYREAFNLAAREDRERVPLRIYGDSINNGWGHVT